MALHTPTSTTRSSPAASGPTSIPTTYSSLHPANIFNVEGLVVVITGGGTGMVFTLWKL